MDADVKTATSSCCWKSIRDEGWAAAAARPVARAARDLIFSRSRGLHERQ